MSLPNCAGFFSGGGGGLGYGLFTYTLLLHPKTLSPSAGGSGWTLPFGPRGSIFIHKNHAVCLFWALSSDAFKEMSLLLGLLVWWALCAPCAGSLSQSCYIKAWRAGAAASAPQITCFTRSALQPWSWSWACNCEFLGGKKDYPGEATQGLLCPRTAGTGGIPSAVPIHDVGFPLGEEDLKWVGCKIKPSVC